MKKWKNIKKSHLTAIVTGIFVVAAGIIVLVNASGLDSIFEPKDFERFENKLEDGNDPDSVAGDGEESDLADENEDGEDNADDDAQKALQIAEADPEEQDTAGLADDRNRRGDAGQDGNPNAFEISDERGPGGIEVRPDGSGEGDQESEAGTRPGETGEGDQPEMPGNPVDPDQPDDPGKPDVPDRPGKPDVPDQPGGSQTWEEEQLKPRDPIQTENGLLVRLTAVIHREYFQGDVFREEDATVTATFRQADGTESELKIPYGGEQGYSVQMSTRYTGKYTATFTYLGVSARAVYEVISSRVAVYYYGENGGNIYAIALPGPLGASQETMDELTELKVLPDSGGDADLTDIHSRLIAYLGDQDIKNRFLADTRYRNVVFLEEKDGYLTNMLSGFQYYLSGNLEEGGPYVYYPVYNWGAGTARNILDVVSAVPEGYKIRRAVQDEGDLGRCRGSQVLEQYTGNDTVLTVPMGVTDIELKGDQGNKAAEIRTMILPESVSRIDFTSIADCLPDLQAYETAKNRSFQVIDGVLYSKDGKTLLSVPAGKTDLVIPETVTAIAKGAFCGSSIRELRVPETVIRLEEGCFENFSGEVIRMEGEGFWEAVSDTGYHGKVLFEDSACDVVLKRGIFAFAGQNIQFGAMDGNGAEIAEKTGLYCYDQTRDIITLTKEPDTLAGVREDLSGYYMVPDGITAIGEGAFAGAGGLREISLPGTVKELREGSLRLSDSIGEILLSADVTEISPKVFGDPAEGIRVPDAAVCVPKEYYDDYVKSWAQILDPVYGAGTAGQLLRIRDDTIFYENEAKYQRVTEDGTERYRLLEMYGTGRTAFQVKDGTSEIAAGAFAQGGSLEILSLPETLKQVESEAFAGCERLETVTAMRAGILSAEMFRESAGVKIYEKGGRQEGDAFDALIYDDFVYDDGVIYGKSADGRYSLLNVPTDHDEGIAIRKNTVCLNQEALKGCTLLAEITVSDQSSLREIGSRCFENCTAVRSLDLDRAHSLSRIGAEAFRSCAGLERLSLPDCLTEISEGLCADCTSLQAVQAKGAVKVGTEAFLRCENLLSGWLTLGWEEMTEIGDRAFAYCSLLTEISDMPKLQSLGIQSYFSCQRLGTVVLPDQLQSMEEECFGECGSLTQVQLNGRLTGISRYCFYGCRNLVDVIFSEQQKNTLQVIGVQAFGQCTSLETLDLSGFPLLEKMGERTFVGCDFLTTVKLPENLEEVPDYCFENCHNLSILTFLSEKAPGLGEAVFGDALSPFIHIWVEEGKLKDYEDAFKTILDQFYGDGTVSKILGMINDKVEFIRGITFEITEEGRVLKEVSEAFEGTYTVPVTTVRIEADAFAGCTKITGIELPQNSSIILGDRCFKGCTALETVELNGDIPQWGMETFMDCTALKRVSIGGGHAEKIPRVGTRAFKGCTGLTGRDAVLFMAQMSVLGAECFADCVNLEAIPMTEYARENLEVIEERTFAGCRSMTQFLTSAFTGMKSIGDQAFYDCDTLRNPSVPAGVTSIGAGCYSECANLETVSFYCVLEEYPKDCFRNCPKLMRTGGTEDALKGLKRIGTGAYEGCVSLTMNDTWNLGRYTGLEEIGADAFKGCTKIEEINLPSAVKKIGAGAFEQCSSVQQMIFQPTAVPEMGVMSLETMGDGFCIRVPDSQSEGDRVYKAYLTFFAEMFGSSRAYEIVDSVSDGAKGRNPLPADLENERSKESAADCPDAEEGMDNEAPKGNERPGYDASEGNAGKEKPDGTAGPEGNTGEEKPDETAGPEGNTGEEKPDETAGPEGNAVEEEPDGNTALEDNR